MGFFRLLTFFSRNGSSALSQSGSSGGLDEVKQETKFYNTSKPIQWLTATESGGLLFHCHGCSYHPTVKTNYCQDYLRQEAILSLECKIQFLHCQRSINHLSCQMLKLLLQCRNSAVPWIDANLKLWWQLQQLNLCFQYKNVQHVRVLIFSYNIK